MHACIQLYKLTHIHTQTFSTDAILQKIQEAGFQIAFKKELTLTKGQAEEFYKEHQDKDFFDSLTTHMST